jgi:transcriptional regulator with XRE-family HTH domain
LIATLRKENNMTQRQLAEKMGVTDKAVSKWERDLSCPDVDSLPRLAEIFGITVDEMLRVKETPAPQPKEDKLAVVQRIFKRAKRTNRRPDKDKRQNRKHANKQVFHKPKRTRALLIPPLFPLGKLTIRLENANEIHRLRRQQKEGKHPTVVRETKQQF